jgi:CubicO group peptidase (beta-lactamase class C family)
MRRALAILAFINILFSYSIPAPVPGAARVQPQSINAVIAHYRVEIPKRMKEHGIPGLAIAVVDDQGVLWAEGFGQTDAVRRMPVTADTLFSIQSMSKSFTATAVTFAVQSGLVDLDTPVSTYLPDFQVNSIFEEAPLGKITLRDLLSHTAGFTHEAPEGSNYTRGGSFEAHIASIQDTWLKFPAGERYAYSNLGIDLAGYILQVRSGKAFPQYVRETIYQPLGMKNSAFATPEIYRVKDRAPGHLYPPFIPPADFVILPSGGVYTSANDMARYLRFHINGGMLDGERLLGEDLLATMYTPPNPASQREGYALGVAVSKRNGARLIEHGGGGFGYKSEMMFYPELKLGIVMLTNASAHKIQRSLPEEILDAIITSQPEMYRQRATANHPAKPALKARTTPAILPDEKCLKLIRQHTLPLDEAAVRRAQKNAGFYLELIFGVPMDNLTLKNSNGQLSNADTMLFEIQPNFYMDDQGEVYDFRGPKIHYRNIPLLKVDGWLLLWITLALGGPGLLGWLFIRLVRRRLQRWFQRKPAGIIQP